MAIELAAARVKLLPPEILLTRLKHRLRVLVSGTRDAPERHQMLRNTMKWSYDLLNADEQRLFRLPGSGRQGCNCLLLLLLKDRSLSAKAMPSRLVRCWKNMGDRQRTAQSLSSLAKAAAVQGDNVTARALYEESLAFARVGHKLNLASGLEGLASVIAAQAEPGRAAQLWGAAEALRETIGAPIPPIERAGYDRAVAAVRVDLGEKVFAATWAEGRSMAPEQALAMQGGAAMSSPISMNQSSTPSTKPSATYPDELTACEVDVLRLVAMGLTDVQVAEKLIISPRTVNAHLTSIYSKIHISSRSAATRYAIEQHLA